MKNNIANIQHLDTLRQAERGNTQTNHGPQSIAIIYPNTYGVGMASLGYQSVRQRLQWCGGVERAFSLNNTAASFENNRPLGDFDILAFSIAFEPDYLHVLQTLQAAAIPINASQRSQADPLIVCGGSALDVNPAPLRPFVDIIARNNSLDTVVKILQAHPRQKLEILETASQDPRLEVTPAARRAAGLPVEEIQNYYWGPNAEHLIFEADFDQLDKLPPWDASRDVIADAHTPQTDSPPTTDIVTPNAELGERVLIEIASGCPHRCAFCWMGHCRGRFRAWPVDTILEAADRAAERTQCDAVGLVSSAVASHPSIDEICRALLDRGRSVSFSSIRAEDITPSMLETLARSGQRGLTLAPEAGNETRRFDINKKLTDDRLIEVVEMAQTAKLENLKLYYMLGLPDETDDDARSIVDLTDRLRKVMLEHGRPRGRLGTLSVNLGIYVRKPGTKLAGKSHPDIKITRKRLQSITRALQAMPNVRTAAASPDMARLQEHLANGGPEVSALLIKALRSPRGDWHDVARSLRRKKS